MLRSKTEMMVLNNQLLEAAQKRLELSLELEAWKVNRRQVQCSAEAEEGCVLWLNSELKSTESKM